MRRVAGMIWGLLVTSCVPPVTHLGGSDYRLHCEEGMAVCRQTANRVCPLGYGTVESSTAADGAGTLLVRCVQPKKKPSVEAIAAGVVLEETKPCPPALPEGLECMRNFQCSGEGARCIDGTCVAATTTNWIESAGDRNGSGRRSSAERMARIAGRGRAAALMTAAEVASASDPWYAT